MEAGVNVELKHATTYPLVEAYAINMAVVENAIFHHVSDTLLPLDYAELTEVGSVAKLKPVNPVHKAEDFATSMVAEDAVKRNIALQVRKKAAFVLLTAEDIAARLQDAAQVLLVPICVEHMVVESGANTKNARVVPRLVDFALRMEGESDVVSMAAQAVHNEWDYVKLMVEVENARWKTAQIVLSVETDALVMAVANVVQSMDAKPPHEKEDIVLHMVADFVWFNNELKMEVSEAWREMDQALKVYHQSYTMIDQKNAQFTRACIRGKVFKKQYEKK